MVNKPTVGEQIKQRLEEFTKKLERGEPIIATRVERVETPDGPRHLRQPIVIVPDK